MILNLSTLTRIRLENTISVLCSIINQQMHTNNDSLYTEYSLRREMVACILGSQVRYEMATTALLRIEQAGLLADKWWVRNDERFETKIFELLSGHNSVLSENWCYRFPKIRANQLAKARDALVKKPLSERLSGISDVKKTRRQLALDIPGIGPKQASMFLRNIGISYDLAILDIHVIDFMKIQNLICLKQTIISNIPEYERIERIIKGYADSLGYTVGCLDRAIWVTMRAAKELKL